MNKNNTIVLVGCIEGTPTFSHNSNGEDFYKANIICRRSSGNEDIIPLMISELFMELIQEEKRFKIQGEIRTHNIDGKLIVSVFVQEINKTEEEDMNIVSLIGYICKNTEIRKTSVSNRQVISFILATNRTYVKTDYIPCICWGRNANKIAQMSIGSRMNLQGRLQSRTYQKNGTEITTYEVSVSNIE